MATNDAVVLRKRVEHQRADIAPGLSVDEYLELFVSEQVLKKYDLSYEELESGIVDGSDDGGIDAMYTIVNGLLVSEDTELSGYKRDVKLELYVIQSKSSEKFQEYPLDKVTNSLSELLDLTRDLSDLSSHYNTGVIESTKRFRETYEELVAESSPTLYITYVYGSMGESSAVHPKIKHRAAELGQTIEALFSRAKFENLFWGARELLEEAQRPSSDRLHLRLTESLTSAEEGESEGYVCLVNLKDYFDFITEQDGSKRQSIFESNVRDYEGGVQVNSAIRNTLARDAPDNFWWLNNGVTVIATGGSIAGRVLSLDDPQIVNGLQTSTEIHSYYRDNPRVLETENRSLLVRVIVTDDSASRDKIITATNSQTTLSAASLRAHDQVQRNIEDYFYSHGYYYERRKNFYKNRKRPKDRIVSIPYLAQSVVAMGLGRPDDSRARPTSLLKRDETYEEIFTANYSIDIYLIAVKSMIACDAYFKSAEARVQLSQEERNNLKFHTVMYAAALKLGKADYPVSEVLSLVPEEFTSDFMASCAAEVSELFRQHVARTGYAADRVAKSRDFVRDIEAALVNDAAGT